MYVKCPGGSLTHSQVPGVSLNPGAVVEAPCCSSLVAQEQLPEDEAPGWQHLNFLGTLHGGRGWLLALCVLCLGVTLLCYLFSDDLKLLSWQVHVPRLLQGTTSVHPSQELQPIPPCILARIWQLDCGTRVSQSIACLF